MNKKVTGLKMDKKQWKNLKKIHMIIVLKN